jgi:uncharacterized membrane protein
VNPFDPKSALLAKHAQHVVLVHFPIALFLTGVAFDFAARWTRKATTDATKSLTKSATLAAAARLNLIAAAAFVLPTIATGIGAWQWQLEGHKLKGLLLLHVVLGGASGLLICLIGWIHFRRRQATDPALPIYYLPLELVTAIVVILTGHLGGFLSGVNVPG